MAIDDIAQNVYTCDDCGYVYDPSKHAGVDLDDQPNWECPVCQADRGHFQIVVPPTDDLVEGDEAGEEDEQPSVSPFERSIYKKQNEPDVSGLKKRYDRGSLDPQPGFQRRALRKHQAETEWPTIGDPVFPTTTGTVLAPNNLGRRVLKPAAEEAGAGWAGFHSTRSGTCARPCCSPKGATRCKFSGG
jgi:rubredoxin